MKFIHNGIEQNITFLEESGRAINFIILLENGNNLSIAGATSFPMTYNTTEECYERKITIPKEVKGQYLRFVFVGGGEPCEEDYKLIDLTMNKAELVPVQYFIDYVLAPETRTEIAYKEILENYISGNKQNIKTILRDAQGLLESKCKLYFTEREITDEKQDYNFDPYNLHLWLFEVLHPPINELVSFKLKYGQQEISNINTDLFVIQREMGTIEFLPNASTHGSFVMMLMNNMAGWSLVMGQSGLSRIPSMFQVTYKSGVITEDTHDNDKEMIRKAVCNRAMLELMPIVDPMARLSNRSESIDGVSASENYNSNTFMQLLTQKEDEFCTNLMREYARNIDCVVV